jgi:hypothetical protein
MRIRGKHISRWWLLLIAPALIVAFPALLMLFFMANNLAGAILGPPAIWDRPGNAPSMKDLAGSYSEYQRHLDQTTDTPHANLTLNSDGSMIAAGLPYEFGEHKCILSGNGSWEAPDVDLRINLRVTSDVGLGSCEPGAYPLLEVAGRRFPHRLYWVVGDPDSGTGVWLERTDVVGSLKSSLR